MNDLTAALLLWLSLTAAPVCADSREPRFSVTALRTPNRPSQSRPQPSDGTGRAQQYDTPSNRTLSNYTTSSNGSLNSLPSPPSLPSSLSIHSLYASPPLEDGPAHMSQHPSSSAFSASLVNSSITSLPPSSTHSLWPNATADTACSSTLSSSSHSEEPQSDLLLESSPRPSLYFSTGNTTLFPLPTSSNNVSEPMSSMRLSAYAPLSQPKATANSSAQDSQSSSPGRGATSAYQAASLRPSNRANATTSSPSPTYTGFASNTHVDLAYQNHENYNTTTPKPTSARPNCHPSYVAALNSGTEGAFKGNVSSELCDACPRTADVLKYQSYSAPGVDQIGHDYAYSCNLAWLQYSKHSSMWWDLVGSKSTSHPPMSTGSTTRMLGRAADPTVLADGFTRMKGISTQPGAWVPTATEEVRTERLPPPTTSTAYHKACLDPNMRDSRSIHTKFPNRKPQCEIGPVQCQYLNHKHAVHVQEDEDDTDEDGQSVQAPICGNRAFNYSTCSIYASKVQIFYWPDATDVFESHASTTPAPSTQPRTAVVGGQTMVSPYVYLSLERIGLAKTWIVDFTSTSAATDLPGATNTLLKLAPELLSTVVYTVPGCKGLCAHHLHSMFSTAPSGDPKHRLHFTAQPYNPATINHDEPVPASAYFWGRVDAGSNLGRVPLPQLFYHPKQQIIWDDYLPQIAVPNDIRKLGPNGTWEGCGLGMGGIYDPPFALTAGSTVAAPDVTPPGGVQPTSVPASPASGFSQGPAPTAFGEQSMPPLTPPSGSAPNAQSMPAPMQKPAQNGFGNPLYPQAPSATPSSDETSPLAPTSFGQSGPVSSAPATLSSSLESSGTVYGNLFSQSVPSTTNGEYPAIQSVTGPDGQIGVAFNPNGGSYTSDTSTGALETSLQGSKGSLPESGRIFSSALVPPTPTASNRASQSQPSVVQGAVAAVALPPVELPSTSTPTMLDVASHAVSSSLSRSSSWTSEVSGVVRGESGTNPMSSYSVGQHPTVSLASNTIAGSAVNDDMRLSQPTVSKPNAGGTQAFATHTLIKNVFGDVVATAALVADQTVVAGGPPASINGNVVSLQPGGQALVVNGATTVSFATTTGQTSHVGGNAATIYRTAITGANSATTTGAALYGTTLTAGGSSAVYSGHTYSAEPSGNVIVDGSRTVQVQTLGTSDSTSPPVSKANPIHSSGTITMAAMTIGPSETICATETAFTDMDGDTRDVVYIGSRTVSMGETITTAGVALTVASTGLIHDGTTARYSTTVFSSSWSLNATAASATGTNTAISPLQADNALGKSAEASRTPSSSTAAKANTATYAKPRRYDIWKAVSVAVLWAHFITL